MKSQELREALASDLSEFIKGIDDISGEIGKKDMEEIKLALESALFFFDTNSVLLGAKELHKAIEILSKYLK